MQQVSEGWRMAWFKAYGFEPNVQQKPIIDDFISGQRIIMATGGERSGKSYSCAAAAGLDIGPRLDEDGEVDDRERRYWIVGPDYRSCRPEFTYIHNALFALDGILEDYLPRDDNSPWSLTTRWGVRIETRTSSDTKKLASFTVDGALMVEAGMQEEEAFRKLRGRVSETRGWIIIVGTLEETNPWYVDRMKEWEAENEYDARAYSLPTWSNTAIYPLGEDDPEIISLRNTLPADYFAFRYAAKPMKSSSLVLPEFDRTLHVSKTLEYIAPDSYTSNASKLELAIDPGFHSFAIAFVQEVGDTLHVLDAIYERNAIVQDLVPQLKKHPLWKHIDATNAGVIDVASKQHHANKSVMDVFREEGIHLRCKKHPLSTSVMSLRNRLRPRPITGIPGVLISSKLRSGYTVSGKTVKAVGPMSEFDLWKKSPHTGEPDKINCDLLKALAYYILDKYGQTTVGKGKNSKYGARRRKGWRRQA